MISFVQLVGRNTSKTSGASLNALAASKVITLGNKIIVVVGSDPGGTAYHASDNLGNTYNLDAEITATNEEARIFSADITSEGILTTVTIAWTTNITAKAALVCEYSGVGALVSNRTSQSGLGNGAGATMSEQTAPYELDQGQLEITSFAVEGPGTDTVNAAAGNGTPTQTCTIEDHIGTTGSGAASNMSVAFADLISATTTTGYVQNATQSGGRNWIAVGATYNPAPAQLKYVRSSYVRSDAQNQAHNW